MVFNPNFWLESLFEELANYVRDEINNAIRNNLNQPVGNQVYKIVFDYPTAESLPEPAEFTKTIIHFSVDNIENRRLGFGDNVIKATEQPNPVAGTDLLSEEAAWHEVNFDVGVWASDLSGGSSSRLKVYQYLHNALFGEIARRKVMSASQGIDIVSFSGGSFIMDRINDIRVYRIVDGELVVRVPSRKTSIPEIIADQPPAWNPTYFVLTLEIDE